MFNRLNDMSLIVIATVVGVCLLAGYALKLWHPKTIEGKVEKEVAEKVIDEIEEHELGFEI